MSDNNKFLTEAGVRRLWEAIEAKFVDNDELAALFSTIKPGTNVESLNDADIDAITGYSQPVASVEDLNTFLQERDNVKVVLNNNLSFSAPITIPEGKTVEITLNKTIVNNSQVAFQVNGGSLILNAKNGTISGSGVALSVNNGGNATVNGGTYISTAGGQVMSSVGAGSTLTINDANMTGQETAAMAFDGATLNINGGKYDTKDNFVVGTNGTAGRGNNIINIHGAKLISNIQTNGYESCGVYIANNDIVTIDGDTEIVANGGCGILMRAGNVVVKSGTMIRTTDGEDGWVGDKKVKMNQSGIIYHESANYPGKANMSLVVENGVLFNVADDNVQILSNETNPNVQVDN